MTEPRLLSIEDAAECMAVSTDSVRNEIEAGRLPCVRIGSRKLVPVVGIEYFIDTYAELGEEMWQDAIEKAVSVAATRTEPARATSARTVSARRASASRVLTIRREGSQ